MKGLAQATVALALALVLSACSSSTTPESDEALAAEEAVSEEQNESASLDAPATEQSDSIDAEFGDDAMASDAPAAVDTEIAALAADYGGTSSEFDEGSARRDARREVYRRGYRGLCTSDCSGHNAGFEWAHDNRLTRPQPTFDSQSFDEGQEEYVKAVNRRVEEKREEFEDDPEYSDYGY